MGPSLRDLPGATRKSLLEDLRAGRHGPAELRPYAVAWTCQNLQAPWRQAPVLASAAGNAGVSADGPIIGPFMLVLLVLVPLLWALGAAGWARRRRAAGRVADALDQLTPPPPPLPPDPA